MKNRNHGLSEKEMELVQLLMADCETTGDILIDVERIDVGHAGTETSISTVPHLMIIPTRNGIS